MRNISKSLIITFYFLIIGTIACILLLWINPWGAGVSPDSTLYISGAKSLLIGKGFSTDNSPISVVPPIYSLFLAAVAVFAHDLVESARLLNAILFGINAGLIALAVYITAGRNFIATTLSVLFCISTASLLELHSWAWSEPLFISFLLTSILLISLYIALPNLLLFFLSSLSLGFAVITRYAGIGFLPAAAIVIFLGSTGPLLRKKLITSLSWSLVACAPLGIVFVRNALMAGNATSRSFVFHPIAVTQFATLVGSQLFDFMAPLVLPGLVKLTITGLLIVICSVILFFVFRNHLREINWHTMHISLVEVCLLFSICYLVFLYINMTFFTANTPVDSRILSPIFVISILGSFSVFYAFSHILKKPVLWWCFLLFVMVFISIKMPQAIKTAARIQEYGLGYSSKHWQTSETIAYVKSLKGDLMIYSNGFDVINFLTGKKSGGLPNKYSAVTLENYPTYNKEIENMCNNIIEKKAILIYLKLINRNYMPTQNELESTCHLPILQDLRDGVVYGELSP